MLLSCQNALAHELVVLLRPADLASDISANDVDPQAALPVMEGKAELCAEFAIRHVALHEKTYVGSESNCSGCAKSCTPCRPLCRRERQML